MHSDIFEQYVSEAIDNIPEPFSDNIENIAFMVEDQPTAMQRKELGLRPCDALFGLYQGVPLPKRGGNQHSIVPDVITIFRHPMIDIHTDVVQLKKQIFKTVWHEVAHYFGLDHDRIDAAQPRAH